MTIYQYHPETKEYLGLREARLNPLEPGQFLIPAHATTDVPLPPKGGFAVIYGSNGWEFIEDNRETFIYEKQTAEKYVVSTLLNL